MSEQELVEGETHYDILREVGEGWDLKRNFMRSLMMPKTEYGEMTFLHVLAGKMPEPTGRYFCRQCDGYLHEEACKNYERYAKDRLKRRVLDEYIQQTCPDCEAPIEEKRPVMEVQSEPVLMEGGKHPTELPTIEEEEKTQYLPCECLHERGEEMIRWDLDRQQLHNDAMKGQFPRWEGDPFKPQDGLTEFERRMGG